ncbi:hypothetical protein Mapa_011856 [Marchantia paleacea]|nr:hypothetical protein Mapa_011856 [Marchantia paleacea]
MSFHKRNHFSVQKLIIENKLDSTIHIKNKRLEDTTCHVHQAGYKASLPCLKVLH